MDRINRMKGWIDRMSVLGGFRLESCESAKILIILSPPFEWMSGQNR
jgi:hypothetical protein